MSDPTPPPASTSRRRRRRVAPGSAWQDIVTGGLPVLACFLGGATEKWAEGIVLAVLGLVLLVAPPRFSLGPVINFILVALLGCAAFAFLPADWFYQPLWRVALSKDFGIALPGSVSAQPWITLSCLGSFLAAVCWFYYVAAQQLEHRSVRRQFRVFAGGVVLLAALCLLLYLKHAALPFWHNDRPFGPFPNRNQTANLFGLAAIIVLACGHDDLRLHKKRWIFWLVGLLLLGTAIVLNFSRSGILIMLGGVALWLAVLALRSRSPGTIAVGVSTVLALLTALLIFGGATLERFNLRTPEGAGISNEFRWLMFQDATRLIASSPWCGIGLGNFESVFAIEQAVSASQYRARHPESDWLWLASEAGWPAVILIVLGALLLARRVFPLSEGTAQRIRLAALIAGLFFALHGLVDVSGHRVGTAFVGLFLFALALRRPGDDDRAGAWLPAIFRITGLLLLALGVTWVVVSYRSVSVPGSLGVDTEVRLAKAANVGQQFREAVSHANRGLEWAPLDWQLYFVRALAKVRLQRPPAEALADFRRARFLEPASFEVPYQEGVAWITTQPGLTFTAWTEALRRAGPDRGPLYDRMTSRAVSSKSEVRELLAELGGEQTDLTLIHLARARDAEFRTALQALLTKDPLLATRSTADKNKVFALWSEFGDAGSLVAYMEQHPEMLEFGWRGVAKQKAAARDFQSAYNLALHHGPRPAMPSVAEGARSAEQLQAALLADPNDYISALALYQEQMRAGNTNDALITVRRLTERASLPAYFHFLEAEAWAARGDWEHAWTAWLRFEEGK